MPLLNPDPETTEQTMQLSQLTNYLETIAPPSYQESYDNTGLIVGNRDMEITKALLCVDSTEEVLDEAIREKCDVVISHHPIVFNGLKKITGKTYVERAVIKAIKHDIAIYCMHTNLDNIRQGVNAKICEKLGLLNTKILVPKIGLQKKMITFCPVADAERVRNALFECGAGHIGNYSETSFNASGFGTFKGSEDANPHVGEKGKRHREEEIKIETIFPAYIENHLIAGLVKAHPYEEVAYDIIPLDNLHQDVGSGMVGNLSAAVDAMDFIKSLKERLNTNCVRFTKPLGGKINRVAVCGGAGSFLLPYAIRSKADIFITGDFKYHEFFDAENEIIIADVGHYESEQFTPELIHGFLSKKFNNFAIQFSKINTNPINYI